MKIFRCKNRHALFFISELNHNCQIYALHSVLKENKLFNPFKKCKLNYVKFEKYFRNYSSFLEEFKEGNPDMSFVIVFGNKDHVDDWPVISTIDNHVIEAQWFNNSYAESIAIFFIPKGVTLLNSEIWESKFKSWISFEDKFDNLIGLPISEKVSKKIFPKILRINSNNTSSLIVMNKIERVIKNQIVQLSKQKTLDDDTQMTIYKLYVNKLNLRHK